MSKENAHVKSSSSLGVVSICQEEFACTYFIKFSNLCCVSKTAYYKINSHLVRSSCASFSESIDSDVVCKLRIYSVVCICFCDKSVKCNGTIFIYKESFLLSLSKWSSIRICQCNAIFRALCVCKTEKALPNSIT